MAEIKEECGVFGIYDLDGNDVTSSIYYGLTSLQPMTEDMMAEYEHNTGVVIVDRFKKDNLQ